MEAAAPALSAAAAPALPPNSGKRGTAARLRTGCGPVGGAEKEVGRRGGWAAGQVQAGRFFYPIFLAALWLRWWRCIHRSAVATCSLDRPHHKSQRRGEAEARRRGLEFSFQPTVSSLRGPADATVESSQWRGRGRHRPHVAAPCSGRGRGETHRQREKSDAARRRVLLPVRHEPLRRRPRRRRRFCCCRSRRRRVVRGLVGRVRSRGAGVGGVGGRRGRSVPGGGGSSSREDGADDLREGGSGFKDRGDSKGRKDGKGGGVLLKSERANEDKSNRIGHYGGSLTRADKRRRQGAVTDPSRH